MSELNLVPRLFPLVEENAWDVGPNYDRMLTYNSVRMRLRAKLCFYSKL